MMNPYASTPNVVIAWVASLTDLGVPLADHGVSTDLPANYADHLPFVRVSRVGGSRRFGFDNARIRLETFAKTFDLAEALANELDTRVEYAMALFDNGAGRIVAASNNQAPQRMPWDDQTVTRFGGLYNVMVKTIEDTGPEL